MEVKSKQMQVTSEKMLFQSENYQYMEQVASQCRGGFLRQLLQETTGRLEKGCGIINDAYIQYFYKLQATSYTAINRRPVFCRCCSALCII